MGSFSYLNLHFLPQYLVIMYAALLLLCSLLLSNIWQCAESSIVYVTGADQSEPVTIARYREQWLTIKF